MTNLTIFQYNGSWNVAVFNSTLVNGTANYTIGTLQGLSQYDYFYGILALSNNSLVYSNTTAFDYGLLNTYTDENFSIMSPANASVQAAPVDIMVNHSSETGMNAFALWQWNGSWNLAANHTTTDSDTNTTAFYADGGVNNFNIGLYNNSGAFIWNTTGSGYYNVTIIGLNAQKGNSPSGWMNASIRGVQADGRSPNSTIYANIQINDSHPLLNGGLYANPNGNLSFPSGTNELLKYGTTYAFVIIDHNMTNWADNTNFFYINGNATGGGTWAQNHSNPDFGVSWGNHTGRPVMGVWAHNITGDLDNGTYNYTISSLAVGNNYFYGIGELDNGTYYYTNTTGFDYALATEVSNATIELPVNASIQLPPFDIQINLSSNIGMANFSLYQYNGSWSLAAYNSTLSNATQNFSINSLVGAPSYDYFYGVVALADNSFAYSNTTNFDYGLTGGCTWVNLSWMGPVNASSQILPYELKLNHSACLDATLKIFRDNGTWVEHVDDITLANGTENYSVTPLSGLPQTYYYAYLALTNGSIVYANTTAYDFAINESTALNSTQTLVHEGDTSYGAIGVLGTTNASHINSTTIHVGWTANSAIGIYRVQTYIQQPAGAYSLVSNETALNLTQFNTTIGFVPASQGLHCTYGIVTATNGTNTYSNATDCDWAFLWDSSPPNVVISSPTTGNSYALGTQPTINAMCSDAWLLNCTFDYHYANGTLIYTPYWKNQNIAAVGTNTTAYYNETLWGGMGDSTYVTANITAMDSHTDKEWKAKKKTKKSDGLVIDNLFFQTGNTTNYEEHYDRIKFWWTEETGDKAKIDMDVIVMSDYPITIIKGSPFAAHIVSNGQWADFQDLADTGFDIKTKQLNTTTVSINIKKNGINGIIVMDPATGGLNNFSAAIAYTLLNYTTLVNQTFNTSTPYVGETVQVNATYNYTNGTLIANADGQWCNTTVTSSNLTNYTWAMNTTNWANNETYSYDYTFSVTGDHVFFSECGAIYHDRNYTQDSLTGNGFSLEVKDEQTLAVIPFNMTMTNASGCIFSRTNQTVFAWPNVTDGICTGAIGVAITAHDGGYVPRQFFYTYGIGSAVNATAYLLAESLGVYSYFSVVDTDFNPIEGARITFTKSFDGGVTYVTIAQADTDAFGSSTFYLDPFTTYLLSVVHASYSPYASSITPQPTTYVIVLGSLEVTTYTQQSKVWARIMPDSAYETGDTITYEVYSWEGNLLNYTLSILNSTYDEIWVRTVTTSPYGGVISVNTSAIPGLPNNTAEPIYANGTWNYNGTDPGLMVRLFHSGWSYDMIANATGIIGGMREFEEQLWYDSNNATASDRTRDNNQRFALGLLSVAIMITVVGSAAARFGFGSGILALILCGFFVMIDWIHPAIGLIAMVLGFVAYLTMRWA